MLHEMVELEDEFFTSSDFLEHICGFNPISEQAHATGSREKKRKPISNALDDKSKESLEIIVQRVSDLLINRQLHTELVLESVIKINTKSNHDLHITLNNTRNSPQLVEFS